MITPAHQMMASLVRVFGTETQVPSALSSAVSDLQTGLSPEGLNHALGALGHISVRRNPEILADALRSGNVFTHASARRMAEISEIGHQPYPWPVRVPFELPPHEIRAYADRKKSNRKCDRDCKNFLARFSEHVREIDPQMAFPSDDVLYGMIFNLVSRIWDDCGVEPLSKRRRFQSLCGAFASYLEGSVPDPRQWRVPPSNKETLRDFYLFRLCGVAVNEMFYAKSRILALNPLADQPPELMSALPFDDCRLYLFRLFHESDAVGKALSRAGVGLYQFHTRGGHGITERMLDEHFDPVPSREPLRVNDVVAFPGSPEYFQKHGLTHVGRVVVTQGPSVWVESQWGLMTHPVIHPLEMTPLLYGSDLFAARPKKHLEPEPSRETIAEAGYRIPSAPPLPEDVLRAATRLASELQSKDLDWIHEHF